VAPKIACDPDNAGISVPAGFCALVFAEGLPHARYLDVAENGDVYVSIEGTIPRDTVTRPAVMALRDTNRDGRADQIEAFGKRGNTGLALHNDWLYVDQGESIVRYFRPPGQLLPAPNGEVVVSGIPLLPGHRARNFAIAPDGVMYVNVGAASNACQVKDRAKESPGMNPCEELDTRAGIWRFDANRINQTFSPLSRYATGARNSTGLAFVPLAMRGADGNARAPSRPGSIQSQQGQRREPPTFMMRAGPLYAMTHGRDQLTENWPKIFPDTLYGTTNPAEEMIQVNAGDDFGWPYCYYSFEVNHLVDAPEYGGDGHRTVLCIGKKAPAAVYPAHWAPLDLMFYTGASFPQQYRGGAFITFHGSWNRVKGMQAGGKIVYQPFRNGKPSGEYQIFADGFAGVPANEVNPAKAKHRPVGIAPGPDGSIYVADDKGGRIYRIIYHGPPAS
jgi:glucose/arabinose dehydrogenase